jgi:hypothetical protein
MKTLSFITITCLLILGSMCGSQWGLYADLLLGLSDQGLFDAGIAGLTGNCKITRGTSTSACDLYAIVKKDDGTWIGLPDLIGTGCVVAPDFPKHMNICWGSPNTYPNYSSTSTPICTTSGVKNAANMIRIGLNRGWCKLPICIAYPNCVSVKV